MMCERVGASVCVCVLCARVYVSGSQHTLNIRSQHGDEAPTHRTTPLSTVATLLYLEKTGARLTPLHDITAGAIIEGRLSGFHYMPLHVASGIAGS